MEQGPETPTGSPIVRDLHRSRLLFEDLRKRADKLILRSEHTEKLRALLEDIVAGRTEVTAVVLETDRGRLAPGEKHVIRFDQNYYHFVSALGKELADRFWPRFETLSERTYTDAQNLLDLSDSLTGSLPPCSRKPSTS